MKPKNIFIDANCIGCLAMFGVCDLRINEMPTAILYGFLKQLQTIWKGTGSNNFVFCWDSRSSKRKKIFPEYKKSREEKSQWQKDLWSTAYEQFNLLKNKYLPAMGFNNQLMLDGYESDDILAKEAQVYKDSIIVTTDGDLLQCLSYADIWNPRKKEIITSENFQEEWGISADRWGEIKCYVGCVSDAVPGLIRIGPKTAIKFLNGTLKEYSKAYETIMNPENKWIIERNKKLVVLPFKGTPLQLLKKNNPSFPAFKKICNELQMNSLMKGKSLGIWEQILEEGYEYTI